MLRLLLVDKVKTLGLGDVVNERASESSAAAKGIRYEQGICVYIGDNGDIQELFGFLVVLGLAVCSAVGLICLCCLTNSQIGIHRTGLVRLCTS